MFDDYKKNWEKEMTCGCIFHAGYLHRLQDITHPANKAADSIRSFVKCRLNESDILI